MHLTPADYRAILKYYKIESLNMNKALIKTTAENIIATKICRCIKKVEKNQFIKKIKNESRPIAICRNSVVNKKNLNIFGFTCKNTPALVAHNKTKKYNKPIKLIKINKILHL